MKATELQVGDVFHHAKHSNYKYRVISLTDPWNSDYITVKSMYSPHTYRTSKRCIDIVLVSRLVSNYPKEVV